MASSAWIGGRFNLVSRVSLSAAAACAISGLVAAAGTGFVASTLVHRLDDRRLGDAAIILAREIDDDRGAHPLAVILDDELHEMQHTPFQFAMDVAGARAVGDPRLPSLAGSSCVSAKELRACSAVSQNGTVVIAAMHATAIRKPLVIAGVLAALAAACIAWVTSRSLGRTIDDEIRRAERFAADASHELRTPLTTIRGELELAIETPDPEVLTRIHGKVVDLQTLTDQLLILALARVAPLNAANPVALDEVIDDVVRESGANVKVTLPTSTAVVNGDPVLLATLVSNAIGNALKFAANVEVVVRHDGPEMLVLEVLDDGPGVPRELRKKVFEPFARGAGVGPGHGLGLAVIASIADRYGGSAAFRDVSSGASLEIRLPVRKKS